jgi:hypothetical protein
VVIVVVETVDVAAALDDTVMPSHVLQQRFLVCSLYVEHAVLTQPASLSPYPQSEEKTT